jgi:hypothetical protein
MGTPAWRAAVAAAVAGSPDMGDGALLAFRLPAGRWVDLDTLVVATLSGARDAGALAPGLRGLDALLATKGAGDPPGAELRVVRAASLRRRRVPGPAAVAVSSDLLVRPGQRSHKLAWRDAISTAWGDRPVLDGDVWTDVALRVDGSLLGPLEVVLDALEPVLGRDPRGRQWQAFFPNDHRITWLRVTRASRGAAVRLRLGALPG